MLSELQLNHPWPQLKHSASDHTTIWCISLSDTNSTPAKLAPLNQPLCVLMPWQAERAIWLTARLSFPLSLPVSHFCRMFLLSWVPYCSHTELAGLPGLLLAARPPNRFFMCLGFPCPSWSGLCVELACFSEPDNTRHLGRNFAEKTVKIRWRIVWGIESSPENLRELHQDQFIKKVSIGRYNCWQSCVCLFLRFTDKLSKILLVGRCYSSCNQVHLCDYLPSPFKRPLFSGS